MGKVKPFLKCSPTCNYGYKSEIRIDLITRKKKRVTGKWCTCKPLTIPDFDFNYEDKQEKDRQTADDFFTRLREGK